MVGFAETDLRAALIDVTEPTVYNTAKSYLTRVSKRLLGMAFLLAYRALAPHSKHRPGDLLAVATALEVRHAAILLHDDIVDGDTMRGGQPTAHHALAASPFAGEGASAAIFTGDLLAALAPLPILRSGLRPREKMRLSDAMLTLTAQVAAGQTAQLYLDTACDLDATDEERILAVHASNFHPYLNCSIHLAADLAGTDGDTATRITTAAIPIAQGFQVQNDLAGFTELHRQLVSGNSEALTFANTSDVSRRRRTTLMRAALDQLTGTRRKRLLAYLRGDAADLEEVIALVRASGAFEHCAGLIASLFADARDRLASDAQLPPEVRDALGDVWQYMLDLYDTDSDVSRLYLHARADPHAPGQAR